MLVDQLAAALERTAPLCDKADWVVMAAWLLQLRSRLLLPAAAPALVAKTQADQLREGLIALRDVQALAAWLDARPQLGRDVFVRGQPEPLGPLLEVEAAVDVIAFLWAAMALFDDDLPDADTTARYRPQWCDMHSVPEARLRILRSLAETQDGQSLDQLLPGADAAAPSGPQSLLKRRSAWTSTLVASLELGKQGDVQLAQEDDFSRIIATRVFSAPHGCA